jgi:hypothetical protein
MRNAIKVNEWQINVKGAGGRGGVGAGARSKQFSIRRKDLNSFFRNHSHGE